MANKELYLNTKNTQRKSSTSSSKMAVPVEQLMELESDEIFDWDVETIDATLKELRITVGTTWKKSKKAYELIKEIEKMKTMQGEEEKLPNSDPNMMMFQLMQKQMADQQLMFQQQMAQSDERLAQIMEKFGDNPNPRGHGGGNGQNKSRAKGRHPEKLERDVDYATFLQWEKSWNLYKVSDSLETLTTPQQTAIFFSLFSKELLSDLEYRFQIDLNTDQEVDEILEKIKSYLKGQRSIILARYNLFTRRQHQGEAFEDWLCEIRRLYDLAEAQAMTGEDLLTVLITTGIKEERVRSKILEELKTPTFDETVKLIEQMMYAKETNARIEKRREDSKINAISSSGKRPSKTLYQKDKETRRFDKAHQSSGKPKSNGENNKCNYCGRDRHTGATIMEKKEKCPAKNATCKNCKKQGHFTDFCYSKKKINCVKIVKVNSTKGKNIVRLEA